MKKFLFLTAFLFFVLSVTFSQDAESPVPLMDEAVRNLAIEIHSKLVEKKAEKIMVGQFVFQNGNTIFSSYWTNQLIGEITNMPGRTYTVLSGGSADMEIIGEIVRAADIIRVYTRIIRTSERAIEGSFYSNFRSDGSINTMLAGGTTGTAGDVSVSTSSSWDSPIFFTIGNNPSASAMSRSIQSSQEDFFLLVPDRDGRLISETTGGLDTYMVFYNYDTGDSLAENDDGGQGTNARISYNVRSGTRYLAVVRGYSSSVSGAYGFRSYIVARENATSWENPLSYEIGVGQDNAAAVNRTIQSGDEDYFLLVPDRDGPLIIETTGRVDMYMELYSSDPRELLEENDDGGTDRNARIRYNVTAGSRYIALVRGYDGRASGNYAFRAYFPGQGLLAADEYEPDNDPAQAKTIEIGEAQRHTFHSSDDTDWVKFQVTKAGSYVIQARGANSNRLDTYIELFDANLNSIAEDDDGGDSLSSRLSVNLNNGLYYLKVWCLDNDPDQEYALSVEAQ